MTMPNYPAELHSLRQWVCWRLEQRKGKATKIPVNPCTGANASTDDPATWGTFDEALAGMRRWRCHGVGFVFTVSDPFAGADLDKCIDPTTGEVTAWAERIVQRLHSYTAFSQSHTGMHIIVRGKLPPGRRQGVFGGLYEARRFFALTGNLYPGAPYTIAERQAELDALYTELFPPIEARRPTTAATLLAVSLTNTEILDKMFAARNGADVRRLWEGDISEYPSASEADLALCSHLAFWCRGDASRIDALFRQSGLYREQKWNRQDYRERTISKALAHGQYYTAPAPTRWPKRTTRIPIPETHWLGPRNTWCGVPVAVRRATT